jgi:hypothetical protein
MITILAPVHDPRYAVGSRALSPAELARITAPDMDRARSVLAQIIHYRPGFQHHEDDVRTIAYALVQERDR